jgi:fructose-1,6-bisphosphatase
MTIGLAMARLLGAPPELAAVLGGIAAAVQRVAAALRAYVPGRGGASGAVNVQGEKQHALDVIANDAFIAACTRAGAVAALASEELEAVHAIGDGPYLVAVDPLDGSSSLDVGMTVGSIFSVLRRAGGFEQAGARLVCAGYALYGPSTMLVLSLGTGVHGFALDPGAGDFVLTHPELRIAAEGWEFAINASNRRFWEPPVQRYIEECVAGRAGPRQTDFNMRWNASFVAEVHRILMRGGVFLYPRDGREPRRPGRLRLLYEAAPMAFLVEQAGGAASTGRARLLDLVPATLHERVPVILGSRAEVERVVRYHDEHERGVDRPYTNPLFGDRSLFSEPR